MKKLCGALLTIVMAACSTGPRLGAVTDVVIEEIGNADPTEQDANCESFSPSPGDVRDFLNSSIIVGSLHHFRWSSCYAKGTASFNGAHAVWVMRQHETGTVFVGSHGIEYNLATPAAIERMRDSMKED
jgi:hypothetical protein